MRTLIGRVLPKSLLMRNICFSISAFRLVSNFIVGAALLPSLLACERIPLLGEGSGLFEAGAGGSSAAAKGGLDDLNLGLNETDGDEAGDDAAKPAPRPDAEPACGDGIINGATEQCDDGNIEANDGCTQLCALEAFYDCSTPGEPCTPLMVCGDGKRVGTEECDDGNSQSGDGCAQTCVAEVGYDCAVPGAPCDGICGDGVLALGEQCDDGNTSTTDGCDASCLIESDVVDDASGRPRYWACNDAGEACERATCGDGTKAGLEPCDDGNDRPGDGCSPTCQVEPSCSAGNCSSSCGDGIIISGDDEECDDGNTLDGDGCDGSCRAEEGWSCALVQQEAPDKLFVPIVYRDFIARPLNGATRHPDFQDYNGQGTPGMVQDSLVDGVPVATGDCVGANVPANGCPYGNQVSSTQSFAQWFTDVPNTNITVVDQLCLEKGSADSYVFNSLTMLPGNCDAIPGGEGQFVPLSGLGWTALGVNQENNTDGNGGFTSAVTTWFEYQGGETLEFSGDDDVWVFINNQLVLDLGGMHPRKEGSVSLNALGEATAEADFGPSPVNTDLGLELGRIYEISVFQAERFFPSSNYKLTLSGFLTSTSSCETQCGDGVRAGDEVCDGGADNKSSSSADAYGACTTSCNFGPYCGDGISQPDSGEVCDDPSAIVNYTVDETPNACTVSCSIPSYCGDGVIDTTFGEQCDEGPGGNDGGQNECGSDCRLSEYCGDGVVQDGEECDKGTSNGQDECTLNCKLQVLR